MSPAGAQALTCIITAVIKNASTWAYKLTGTSLSVSSSAVTTRLQRAEKMDAISVALNRLQPEGDNYPQVASGCSAFGYVQNYFPT